MKLYLFALAWILAVPVYAQESAPVDPPAAVTLSDEADRLKVQTQILSQENAALRKQLAQAALQLAEANERTTQEAGNQLVKQLADKLGVKLEEYEFRIDDKGVMKFVRKESAGK